MGIFVCAGDTPNQESITVPRNDRVANNSNTMMCLRERERDGEKIAFFACRRLNVWMLDRHCIPRGYIDKKLSARTLNFEKTHVHTSPTSALKYER